MKERDNQQMALQDGSGTISAKPFDRLVRSYRYALDSIIHAMVLCWVYIMFLDGLLTIKIGFDRIETIYYFFLLGLLVVRMIVVAIDRLTLLYLIGLAATVLIGILVTNPVTQLLLDDFRYTVRSIVLGAYIFWFYRTTSFITYEKVRFVFLLFWCSITIFILLHLFFGLGGIIGRSGEIKPEYTSYFREFNVMAFAYLMAWFHLFATSRGIIKRGAYTIVSLVIAALMGSKACLLMIVILFFLFFVFYFIRRSYGRKLFVQFSVVLLTVSFFVFWADIWKLLLDLFSKISPDGAVILSRLKTQDILTVVFSTRNLKMLALLDVMQKKGLAEWLFGMGATETINGNVLIESDPFDVFKVYGLIGVIIIYVAISLAAWRLVDKQRRLRREAFNFYVFYYGLVAAVFVVPPLTGHIFSSPGGMLFLGLLFGVVGSERMRNEMETFSKRLFVA